MDVENTSRKLQENVSGECVDKRKQIKKRLDNAIMLKNWNDIERYLNELTDYDINILVKKCENDFIPETWNSKE